MLTLQATPPILTVQVDVYSFAVTAWCVTQYLDMERQPGAASLEERATLLQPYRELKPWQIVTRYEGRLDDGWRR